MLTTEPGSPCSIQRRPQAKVEKSAPSITVERTAAKPRGLISVDGAMKLAAALLTRPVSGPARHMVSTIDSICSASRTSQTCASIEPPCCACAPSSATVCSSTAGRRPQMCTAAPRATKARESSLPRPVPPPVTRMRSPRSTSGRNGSLIESSIRVSCLFCKRSRNRVASDGSLARLCSRPEIREQLPTDDVLHDLDGAPRDLDDAGIGIGPRDRVFPHVAPPAEQLQALTHHAAVQIAQVHLGHRRVDGIEPAFHEQLDAFVGELAPYRCIGGQLRQLELRVLEVADSLAKSFEFAGLQDVVFDQKLANCRPPDRRRKPFLRELGHHQFEALSLLAQH